MITFSFLNIICLSFPNIICLTTIVVAYYGSARIQTEFYQSFIVFIKINAYSETKMMVKIGFYAVITFLVIGGLLIAAEPVAITVLSKRGGLGNCDYSEIRTFDIRSMESLKCIMQ